MAEIVYEGNLSSSQMPFVSTYKSRTVMVSGIDQNYIRGLASGENGLIDGASRGIPQIMYMHNVIPSTEGFQSVGFKSRVGAIGVPADIKDLILVKDVVSIGSEVACYLTWSKTANSFYSLTQNGAGVWSWAAVVTTGVIDHNLTDRVTAAQVNGVTYLLLYFSAQQCRQYNQFANQLNTVALLGTAAAFPAGLIKGNLSCFGYQLLWDELTVAWSSTINPLDFVPSLITGAGYSRVEGARGQIVAVIPHQLGFIVYTTGNAIAGIYTGNARFPFQFKEITGVGGFPDYNSATMNAADLISDDSNTAAHFAYSSSGLQQISASQIINVLPDVTDFISGNYIEDFNTTTLLFTRTKLTNQLFKRVNVVADRYLVISYGTTAGVYTHALVYDIINKRMGKLKYTHVACVTLANVVTLGTGTSTAPSTGPRGSIGLLLNTGAIYTVDFDTVDTDVFPPDSCILIGRFQEIRSRLITLERVEFENVQLGAGLIAYAYTSLDGKNWTINDTTTAPTALTLKSTADNLRMWSAHVSGINHAILLVGSFYANSFILRFHRNGRR